MSNPAVAPNAPFSIDGDLPPSATFAWWDEPEWIEFRKKASSVEAVNAALLQVPMEKHPSFVVPRQLCRDEGIIKAKGARFGVAAKGTVSLRRRSGIAFELLTTVWRHLALDERPAIAAKIEDTVLVEGGAEYTVGRLAKYLNVAKPTNPPTMDEAEQAVIANGVALIELPHHAYRAYPLVPLIEGEKVVHVNPKATMGFPTLAKGDDMEGAAIAARLALDMRQEIVAASRQPGGVRAWLRHAYNNQPHLMALQGKAKGDYYSAAKVQRKELRFYNAFPRQVMLNIQVATQALEACKRSIFTDERARTTVGISLTRGGAAELVAAMQAQLDRDGFAYAHCGDDTWIALQRGSLVTMFALDCSSFDLTQDEATSLPVHRIIARNLRMVDAPAADLWLGYMRARLVVVALATTGIMTRGGPSGAALQSTVNGAIMDVACQRLKRRLSLKEGSIGEADVAREVARVGTELGLVVRLEQFSATNAGSLREALHVREFLFLGYKFWSDGWHGVHVYCDVARQLAQLPYAGIKWTKGKLNFEVLEAMRLGSVVLNWGVPPPRFEAAFGAARDWVIAKVESVCLRHGANLTHPSLRWAVNESPFACRTEPSLEGLLRVLKRPPAVLWDHAEVELTSISELVEEESSDWALIVEREEEVERERLGIPRRPERDLAMEARAARVRGNTFSVTPSTHPITEKNWGRPGPTAVWLPDRAPRPKRVGGAMSRHLAVRARVLADDSDEEAYDYEESYRQQDNYGDDGDSPAYEGPDGEHLSLEQYDTFVRTGVLVRRRRGDA